MPLWPEKYQFPGTYGSQSQTKPQPFQLLLLLVWDWRRGSCTNRDEQSFFICVVGNLVGYGMDSRWHGHMQPRKEIWTLAAMKQTSLSMTLQWTGTIQGGSAQKILNRLLFCITWLEDLTVPKLPLTEVFMVQWVLYCWSCRECFGQGTSLFHLWTFC